MGNRSYRCTVFAVNLKPPDFEYFSTIQGIFQFEGYAPFEFSVEDWEMAGFAAVLTRKQKEITSYEKHTIIRAAMDVYYNNRHAMYKEDFKWTQVQICSDDGYLKRFFE